MDIFDDKSFLAGSGEPLVRAFSSDGCPISFPVSSIDAIKGTRDGGSLLILRSGIEIAIALPHAELEKRIYGPADKNGPEDPLDLREATKPKPAEISKTVSFNKTTARPTAVPQLEISATLRKLGSGRSAFFVFSESDIASLEDFAGGTRIAFKNGGKDPFGTGEALLNMSAVAFRRLIDDAKRNRQTRLDLSSDANKKETVWKSPSAR